MTRSAPRRDVIDGYVSAFPHVRGGRTVDAHFEFTRGALALLGRKCHMLVDVPLVRRHKPPGLVHGPFHADSLATLLTSTYPKMETLELCRRREVQWQDR